MPYITQSRRDRFDGELEILAANIESSGELNYCISKLLHLLVGKNGIKYETVNSLMGTLDCVGKEFYRKVATPYENRKELENGGLD
jgi:hypothetical protein